MSEFLTDWRAFLNASWTSYWIDQQLKHWQGNSWHKFGSNGPWIGDSKQETKKSACGFLWLETCNVTIGYDKPGLQSVHDGFSSVNQAQWNGLSGKHKARTAIGVLERDNKLETDLSRASAVIRMDLIEFGDPIYNELPNSGRGGTIYLENKANKTALVSGEAIYTQSNGWSNTIDNGWNRGISTTVGAKFSTEANAVVAKIGMEFSIDVTGSLEWNHSDSETDSWDKSFTQSTTVTYELEPGEKIGVRTIVTESNVTMPYKVYADVEGDMKLEGKGPYSRGSHSRGGVSGVGSIQNLGETYIGKWAQNIDGNRFRLPIEGTLEVEEFVDVTSVAFDVNEGFKSAVMPSARSLSTKSKNLKNQLEQYDKEASIDSSSVTDVDGNEIPMGDLFEINQSNKTYIGSDNMDIFELASDSTGNTLVGGDGVNFFNMGDGDDLIAALNNGGTDTITGGKGSTRVFAKNTNPMFELGKGSDYIDLRISTKIDGIIDLGDDNKKDYISIKVKGDAVKPETSEVDVTIKNFDFTKDVLEVTVKNKLRFKDSGNELAIFDGKNHLITMPGVSIEESHKFVYDKINEIASVI